MPLSGFLKSEMVIMVMMINCTINPPTPCLWQAPASAQKIKKESQAAHSPERAVEGQEEMAIMDESDDTSRNVSWQGLL